MGFAAAVAFVAANAAQIALVASITFQVYQAKKMRKAARDAAEARKGFEMVVENAVQAIPIVYGRAKVGGVRVFCETSNTFKYPTQLNSDKTFNLSHDGGSGSGLPIPGRLFNALDYNSAGELVEVEKELPPIESGALNRNLDGSKNEFLYQQQVLCMGPIHAVHDLLINDSPINDPRFVSAGKRGPKAAFRADAYYNGKACNVTAANFGDRAEAKFPQVAHLSTVIRLDRDDPQFNGVPEVQAIIEGRLVRTINSDFTLGALSYSNNPALCLLDYLLDKTSGAAVSLDKIDLKSFHEAATVCSKIVMGGASVGGKVWQPTDNSRKVEVRQVPLYEANIIIDTTKPVRENVENLLSCMGDARLVWSQGTYKLLLQYPETNAAIQVAGELTDDDLVSADNIEISWPSSSERLNHATVRYGDEANDFKENSVSWPPKEAGVYPRGVGGSAYPSVSGWDNSARWKLLNSYGVWNFNRQHTSFRWPIYIKNPGTYTFEFCADDSCTGTLGSMSFSGGTGTKTLTVSQPHTVLVLEVDVHDTGGLKGFAGTLTSANKIQVWTSRAVAHARIDIIHQTDHVYQTYLAEDSQLQLETDVFGEGVTDYYHALAKAEELVRTSRSAFTMNFKYFIRDKYFEPGDIIKLKSSFLEIPEVYLRVLETKVEDNLVASLSCSRFDASQLAWNVADDQPGGPGSVWTDRLPAPAWVQYDPQSKILEASSGTVKWAAVDDIRVSGYRVYYYGAGNDDANGNPQFLEIGRTAETSFELPALAAQGAVFGVTSATLAGLESEMTLSGPIVLYKGPPPPKPLNLVAEPSTTQSEIALSWSRPNLREDGSAYTDHLTTVIYRASEDDFSKAKSVGQSSSESYIDTILGYGDLYYWVQFVSRTSVHGLESDSAGPVRFHVSDGVNPDAEDPPPPFNLNVTAGLTFFHITWDNPQHNIGGGHKASRVYGKPWVDDLTPPSGAWELLAETSNTTFFFPAAISKRWSFIVRELSREGGLSSAYAGPVVAKTGVIGNADLGPGIIESQNIAENSISEQKFIQGLEGIRYVTSVPSSKLSPNANTISVNGILYKWNNSSSRYEAVVNTTDLVGKIVAAQISDGAISSTKFAAGIAPVELVNSLPTSGNFEGRQVSLKTEDGALYHYVNGGWKANLAPNSVTETAITSDAVTAPKIKAGAIVAGKLAANAVTAGTIAAGAVNAREISAGSITGDKIHAGSITGDKIAARSITATNIVSGSISSNELAANSVVAGKIATGAITADKLAAGSIAAGSAAIANGAIMNALIRDLWATNGVIQNLSVDTLRIRGNAVTIPSGTSGGWQTYNFNNGTIHVLASLTINSEGSPILVNAGIHNIAGSVPTQSSWQAPSATLYIELVINGSLVTTVEVPHQIVTVFDSSETGGASYFVSFGRAVTIPPFYYTFGAGSKNIFIRVRAISTRGFSVYFGNCSISLLECKR